MAFNGKNNKFKKITIFIHEIVLSCLIFLNRNHYFKHNTPKKYNTFFIQFDI